jgi:hypothetical protein
MTLAINGRWEQDHWLNMITHKQHTLIREIKSLLPICTAFGTVYKLNNRALLAGPAQSIKKLRNKGGSRTVNSVH